MDPQENFEHDDIVRISEGGSEYSIYLPDRNVDYIQKFIFDQRLPYERDMLVNMCSHLQTGDIVLDIGANVGNHTLYLAGIGQAKVLAFEPNRHLADAIRRSVQLSGLEQTVTVFNIGLGRKSARAHFEKDIPENLGAQKLELGVGDLEVVRLDDLNIPSPVKLIKIDVEGMELDVLEGSRQLILRDRPLLYVESATEAHYRQISTILAELGYGYWEGFNATPTHCFRPLASISLNGQVERLIQREVFQEYRLREQLRLAYRAQNEAIAKGRVLEQQVASLSTDLASKTEQLKETKNILTFTEEALVSKGDLLEKEASVLERYKYELKTIQTQMDEINGLHSEITKVLDGVGSELSFKDAVEGLLSETANIKHLLTKRSEELDALRVRLATTESQLETIVDSTSYHLSKKIIEGGTSLSGFLRLPFVMTVLAIRGVSRRMAKGRKNTYSRRLDLRAKDYIIREIKARPILERPARKALNWWRAKTGREVVSTSPTDAMYRNGKLGAGKKTPFASEIKVATILDEFSFGSFACEFKAIPIEPDNWKDLFETEKPDLFLCESAWSGSDPVRRPWKGKIYASVNFKTENRKTLLEVIEYCKINGIPTIFWNKEDPTHFNDRIHDFVKTAQLFDFIFTSAEECVDQYKLDYNCTHVYSLPFATQPRLFNPIEIVEKRTDDIVFAGSWYAQHPERSALMNRVLNKILDDGFSLKIFDRHFGGDDKNHFFPERFQSYVNPSVRHKEIDRVYKSSIYGLNFNTVVESRTMFARRVFELASSNTLILSNYSTGVDEIFGDSVVFVDRDPSRLSALNSADIQAMREKALNTVLEKHTYEKRWEYILSCIGFDYKKNDNALTVVCRISSHEDAEKCIFYANHLDSVVPSSTLLLLIDKQVPDSDVSTFYQTYNRYGHGVVSESYLENYADEFDEIVGTPNVLYVPNCNFPPPDWVEKSISHLVYTEKRYISFDQKQEKYRFCSVDVSKPLLCRAAGMQALLKKGGNEWLWAFYV